MKEFTKFLLNEKIILGLLAIIFSMLMMWGIHWNADKEIIGTFGTLASMCVGALTRGIVHQAPESDSSQDVRSTTTVSPKPVIPEGAQNGSH
jgi:hypothetical protein